MLESDPDSRICLDDVTKQLEAAFQQAMKYQESIQDFAHMTSAPEAVGSNQPDP